jgi:hypothetical protein
MAGLFDFKSAEQILQERRATTEQNRLQMLRDVSQGANRPEVVRLGANLGYLLGKSLFGGKSEKEQLTEAREMGETTQAMEQAGVGTEGSSYGAGVQQQAQAEEQRRLGLLPQEMQDAVRKEKQAKQLEQAFQNVDMDDPKATAELVKLALVSGNNEAASLAVNFNKNAVEKAKGTAPQSAIGKMIADRGAIAANNPNDPRLADIDRAIQAKAKAPTTRTIYDGKDRINQEWDSKKGLWKEVGRGQPDSNAPTVVVNNANTWSKLDSAYQRDTKAIQEGYRDLTKVRAALGTKGGAANQAIQASLAQAFGGSTRAVAELEKWATFGNLPARVFNSINKFFEGDYTDTARTDVLRLIKSHEVLLAEQHRAVNERFIKVGVANEVDPSTFMIDVPDTQTLDFTTMDVQALSEINVESLDAIEREELEDRLDELGL